MTRAELAQVDYRSATQGRVALLVVVANGPLVLIGPAGQEQLTRAIGGLHRVVDLTYGLAAGRMAHFVEAIENGYDHPLFFKGGPAWAEPSSLFFFFFFLF